MGVDAQIFFERASDNDETDEWGNYWKFNTWRVNPEQCPPLATHEVTDLGRYFSPDYPRGHWPYLASVLMSLFATEGIVRVWYLPETWDRASARPFTPRDLIEYSLHYMQHYRG